MAKLVFRTGQYSGKKVTLPVGKTITLGRNRDLELPLPDLKLSRRHCQIISTAEKWFVKDLGSTNGTFVNGTRIANETELQDFDRVVLGDTELEFLEESQRLSMNAEASKTPIGAPAVEMPKPPPRIVAQPAEALKIMEELVEEPASPTGGSGELIVEDYTAEPQVVVIPAPALAGAQMSLPPTGVSPPVPPMEPLEVALRELATPLPPEPPLAAPAQATVTFCDGCDGSIPGLDFDLGNARQIAGKNYCKDCLAKSAAAQAQLGVQRPAPQGQAAVAQARPRPVEKTRSVDDMLAGLDDEAVVVDTTLKRRGQVVADEDVSKASKQMEDTQQLISRRNPAPSVIPAPAPRPAPPPAPRQATPNELLADEFEELK